MVPKSQADEYNQFVNEYSQYWQTFFDPIALRIQIQPDKTRLETIVLPLINNSAYTGMASVLGGKPAHLDSLLLPDSNIASLALKLDKSRLLVQMGIEKPQPKSAEEESNGATEDRSPAKISTVQMEQSLLQIGLALHNFHSAHNQFPPTSTRGGELPAGDHLSWRVQILPFLGEQELYAKFHLDEPWNSEHNLLLAKEIPDVLASR